MADTGKGLPRAQAHGGHGSLIARTSYGSTETRFDSSGKRMDGFVTVKGVNGRKKVF